MKTLHCSALVWPSPVGPLTLVEENEALTGLHFGALPPAGAETNPHPLLREAVRQLEEYFEGQRKEFDLPLAARGTPFQLRVWAALRQIPYGETRTYADIAAAAGCPRGFRAVGMANNKNPISIITPCHRVIGKGGALVGFGGGLETKQKLLELEASHL